MWMTQKRNKRSSLGFASCPFRRQYFFMKIYGPHATLLIYNSSIETYSGNAEITIFEDHSSILSIPYYMGADGNRTGLALQQANALLFELLCSFNSCLQS